MKTAFAIVCSCLLAGAPFLLAQAALPCVKQNHACCHSGCKMDCCAAKSSPDSQPTPAVPAQSGDQNQFSLLAPHALAWALLNNETHPISFTVFSLSSVASAPLYALDCARQVPLDEIYIVPVRLDDCAVPRIIQHELQYIDLFPDWDAGMDRLRTMLRRELEHRRPAPAFPPQELT